MEPWISNTGNPTDHNTKKLYVPFDHFPKSSVHGVARKHKWQKADTYIDNQTYKRLVRMAAPISYSMAWSVGSAKFICLCINFSHYLNHRISDTVFQFPEIQFSRQITPNNAKHIEWRFYHLLYVFLIVNITLQSRIWSDSEKDSDEKAKYQDLHYHQLLKINKTINFPS